MRPTCICIYINTLKSHTLNSKPLQTTSSATSSSSSSPLHIQFFSQATMLSTNCKADHDHHQFPQKSTDSSNNCATFQIKQDDQFFCRLLSKESSVSYPSFRVSLAIPFEWESEPGTPKSPLRETNFPTLTPPPCYHFQTTMNTDFSSKRKVKRPRFMLSKTLVNFILCMC